jgi:hypothetical protein
VIDDALDALAHALRTRRYAFVDEAELQAQIASVLDGLAPGAFGREVVLHRGARRDRPDFFHAATGIAIEIKTAFTGGSPAHVERQLTSVIGR